MCIRDSHWGVFGAALATITSQIISTVILTYYFIKKGQMRLRKETLRLDPFICKRILGLGFSSGVTQMAGTILQITMNNMLITQGNASIYGGDIALSAMGIVTKISMILTSICIGISIGSQPIIGFNRGAKAFPVSYTHLDVYKRQSMSVCGLRFSCTASRKCR